MLFEFIFLECSNDICGDVSFDGQCDGDVFIWCADDGILMIEDCVVKNYVCGMQVGEIGYWCVLGLGDFC